MSSIKLGEVTFDTDSPHIKLSNFRDDLVAKEDKNKFMIICPKCKNFNNVTLKFQLALFSKGKLIMKCECCGHEDILK